MPTPTIVCQGHFEDTVDLSSANHIDNLSALVDIPTGHWFLFVSCQEDIEAGGSFAGWTSVDHANFSQTFGHAPTGFRGTVQAFGPGLNLYDALTNRSEFATVDSQIDSGETLAVWTQSGGSRVLKKRVYLGLVWDGFLDSPYPNSPAGYSDIPAFDGFEESYPAGGSGTAVSKMLPADDRYWTRTGADPQGRPGMLLGYVGWEASASPTFTVDAGWTLAALYDPADTYAVAVYYKMFGPDDDDHTFSGTFSSSTAFQTSIAAYRVLSDELPPFADGPGIRFSFGTGTHEAPDWTRVDDPAQPSESG